MYRQLLNMLRDTHPEKQKSAKDTGSVGNGNLISVKIVLTVYLGDGNTWNLSSGKWQGREVELVTL